MTGYSPILGIPQISPSQNYKEATANTADADLEAAFNAELIVTFTGSDVTLTQDQFASAIHFLTSGNTTALNFIIPQTSVASNPYTRLFIVDNGGSHSLTVKGATGSSVVLAPGAVALMYSDGVNVTSFLSSSNPGISVSNTAGVVDAAATAMKLDTNFFTVTDLSAGDVNITFKAPGSAGLVWFNGTIFTDGTIGPSLTLNAGGTLELTPVAAGIVLSNGTSLSSTPLPSAGVVYYTGTTFEPVAFGNHVTLTSANTLDTYGYGTMAVQNSNSVSITGGAITGMPTPTNPSDVAIKSYVDLALQSLQLKPTATVATTAALPTNTYLSNVITITATGTLTVDSYVTALGDLILVKNEAGAAAANNGLYTVTTAGAVGVQAVLTRHIDMTASNEFSGALVPVGAAGSINGNSMWLANPTTPVVVGTTVIPFTQIGSAGTGVTSLGGNTGVITLSTDFTINSGTLEVVAQNPGTGGLLSGTGSNTGAFEITTFNNGGLTWSAGQLQLNLVSGPNVTITNGNTINASAGGVAAITDSTNTVGAGGTLNISTGLTLNSGGTLSSAGGVAAITDSTHTVGAGGTLHISTGLTLNSGGTLSSSGGGGISAGVVWASIVAINGALVGAL